MIRARQFHLFNPDRRSNVNTNQMLKKEVPVEVRTPEVIDTRVIRARVAQMKRDRSRYIASFK